uniref:Nanog homeobox retrogene P8 n=1 Tax=Myotis myotis TaxID=51298 RepID=A0A7J7RCR0_MYOMY|nr:Nanog homeobox retrogene P8 [Myotis myotis]
MSSAETLHTGTALSESPGSPTSPSRPSATLPTSVENGTGRRRKPRSRIRRSEPSAHSPSSVDSMRDFKDRNISASSRGKNVPTSRPLATNRVRPGSRTGERNVGGGRSTTGQRRATVAPGAQQLQTTRASHLPPGCLANAAGNLSMWSSHSWSSPSWNYPAWNGQTWCPQAWNSQFYSYGEESLQPQSQFWQNPVRDLEASLEIAGETYNGILQAPTYCGTQQSRIYSQIIP